MSAPPAHTLVLPWSAGTPLRTWCGKQADKLPKDHLAATRPEAVTCPGCRWAMRAALASLREWVPRLPEDEEATS